MNMPNSPLKLVIYALLISITAFNTSHTDAQMPKEDVIDVPAIGKDLCTHNLFQSNMVIQRNKPIRIWGWAKPGESITVKFNNKQANTNADKDRSWSVTLPAMEANAKPQTITIKGENKTLTLNNILIGDVWVLGGQSNMEFPISKVENGQLEIVSANFPQIRILTVPAQHGPEPQKAFPRLHEWSSWSSRHFRKGDWQTCTPQTVRELSAIGYVFARRLHTATQIPIGVIDASRGGTTVETWTPANVIKQINAKEVKSLLADWDEQIKAWDPKADLENRIKRHHDWVANMKKQGKEIPADRVEPTDLRPGPAMNHNRPGSCYAGTINPLAGFSVKGIIFHQGYNNCFNGTEGAIMYSHVFPEMIKAWRKTFNDEKLPFGILSLCTAGEAQTHDNYSSLLADVGPYIREAQYNTFLKLHQSGDEQIGFVSTYDLRRRWYHPQLKIPAGERIARWALATQYGFDREISWQPPIIKEVKAEDGQITITFDRSVSPVDNGRPIEGFGIADQNRQFHPATADYLVIGEDNRGRPSKDTKTIVLKSNMVPNPTHFRYAWARSPMGNLQVTRNTDIPLATQRSDNWRLEHVPAGVFGDNPPDEINRGERRKLQQALQQLDINRKLKEAKAFIEQHDKKVAGGK